MNMQQFDSHFLHSYSHYFLLDELIQEKKDLDTPKLGLLMEEGIADFFGHEVGFFHQDAVEVPTYLRICI